MNYKSKIAVFGGSFNPPTKSHRRIINNLSKEFNKVIVVPVFSPPHKSGLVSFDHRVEMLKLLTKDLMNCAVSEVDREISLRNFEIKEDPTNYTFETMNALQSLNEEDVVFVSGPDVSILNYKRNEEIREHYVYSNDYEERSSKFRNMFSAGDYKSAKKILTEDVWDYVATRKIYDPKVDVEKNVIADGYFSLLDLQVTYDSSLLDKNSKRESFTRTVIEPKNSIGITLFDPINNKVLLKREKRFGPYIESGCLFSYGVIEGTMEKGECPIGCAIREVEEESGIQIKEDDVTLINSWYPSAGYMTERKHVLIGLFDIGQYKKSGFLHGLESENEEIFTEVFDLNEILFHHVTPGADIFSPEIATILLYIKFGKF